MTDTPEPGFWTELAESYFRAIATWWSTAGLGVTADELDAAVRAAIGEAPWRPFVNAGHLTGHDEWLYGFALPGSGLAIRSGMAMQCDVILTTLAPGRAITCEDSLAIADEVIRAELASAFPSGLGEDRGPARIHVAPARNNASARSAPAGCGPGLLAAVLAAARSGVRRGRIANLPAMGRG